jgi:hypothetical protein
MTKMWHAIDHSCCSVISFVENLPVIFQKQLSVCQDHAVADMALQVQSSSRKLDLSALSNCLFPSKQLAVSVISLQTKINIIGPCSYIAPMDKWLNDLTNNMEWRIHISYIGKRTQNQLRLKVTIPPQIIHAHLWCVDCVLHPLSLNKSR